MRYSSFENRLKPVCILEIVKNSSTERYGKMGKTEKDKTKRSVSTKKIQKTAKTPLITENVESLLELHKLQGVLLTHLRKQIG